MSVVLFVVCWVELLSVGAPFFVAVFVHLSVEVDDLSVEVGFF